MKMNLIRIAQVVIVIALLSSCKRNEVVNNDLNNYETAVSEWTTEMVVENEAPERHNEEEENIQVAKETTTMKEGKETKKQEEINTTKKEKKNSTSKEEIITEKKVNKKSKNKEENQTEENSKDNIKDTQLDENNKNSEFVGTWKCYEEGSVFQFCADGKGTVVKDDKSNEFLWMLSSNESDNVITLKYKKKSEEYIYVSTEEAIVLMDVATYNPVINLYKYVEEVETDASKVDESKDTIVGAWIDKDGKNYLFSENDKFESDDIKSGEWHLNQRDGNTILTIANGDDVEDYLVEITENKIVIQNLSGSKKIVLTRK